MTPSLNSEPERPPLSASPAKKSPPVSNSSNSTSAPPKASPSTPPSKENNSPAPTTNAPTPKKSLLSPPPPPTDDATSSGGPPPGVSPPPPQQPPPPPPPPLPAQSPPPPPSKTIPPASQESPPYNSSPPRVASPPPQGGGGANLPPRSPPAPLAPPFYSSTTPRTPPDDHATLPTPQSTSPSGSSPRPSPSLETPTSNVAYNTDPPKPNESSHGQVHIAATTVAAGAFAIVAFAAVIFFLQRRRKKTGMYNTAYVAPSPHNSSGTSRSNDGEILHSPPEGGGIGNPKTWFTYEELNKATKGFASQNILGSGGFGCVYKGNLQDGQEVAVKKLKDDSGQGDREFKAEVEIITRVHHRHLVSLVGYCISEYQKLLVYEYVPNNTLHHHLHDSTKSVMQWPLRVKVACGSAHGIAYLHEDCIPRIIHRDIKSANILLDNNFEAKVADFGLAKLVEEWESKSHVSTRVVGTFGYMAPEYARSGKLTEKSDVFSFGVVLLELITGRKPVDETRPLGHESLVEWARPLLTEALESHNADELVDPRLGGNYDRDEMFRMIEAAAACVRHSATKRPKMTQLVREFDSWGEPPDLTNGVKPGQSRVYDSREQSAEIRMFERMRFESQDFYDSESSWKSGGTGTG